MKRRLPRSNKIKRAAPLLRMPVSPLARLKPHMDVFQFTAADEIIAASSMSAGLPVTRDPDLDIPLPGVRAGAADQRAACRTDLVGAQRRWRADLAGSLALRVAEAVLFHEQPLSDLDAANRWRKGTARGHLATALKHFAALRGNVPNGSRNEWTYNREKETTT